jgi:transcription antitermination factor NusG
VPLLRREADIYPDGFFDLPAERYAWAVAHVRSRQEKMLARYLAERDVPFYLPQFARVRRSAGRTLTSHLPLFPGYVFYRGGRGERDVVLRSNLVANLLDVPDQERLARELSQIHDLANAGASLLPWETLLPGDPVRVDSGAFSGYTGIVLREKGRDRLVVEVALIRRAVAIEFDRAALTTRR